MTVTPWSSDRSRPSHRSTRAARAAAAPARAPVPAPARARARARTPSSRRSSGASGIGGSTGGTTGGTSGSGAGAGGTSGTATVADGPGGRPAPPSVGADGDPEHPDRQVGLGLERHDGAGRGAVALAAGVLDQVLRELVAHLRLVGRELLAVGRVQVDRVACSGRTPGGSRSCGGRPSPWPACGPARRVAPTIGTCDRRGLRQGPRSSVRCREKRSRWGAETGLPGQPPRSESGPATAQTAGIIAVRTAAIPAPTAPPRRVASSWGMPDGCEPETESPEGHRLHPPLRPPGDGSSTANEHHRAAGRDQRRVAVEHVQA